MFPLLKSFHSMRRIFDETYGCIFCLNINLSIKLVFQVQWNLLTGGSGDVYFKKEIKITC